MGSWGRFFAVGVGVALLGVASNCANGSSYNPTGDDGGSDGSLGDGAGGSSGGSSGGDSGCTNGEQSCNGSCVNTSTNPSNCGGCGKPCAQGLLCSGGMCSDTCNSADGGSQTVCPGGADGGPSQPFCSNLQTDPANCGMCGKSCGPNHACQAGSCILNCPPSQTPCVSGDTCVPVGACCTTNDCTIAGETCATPGSACTCPGGQKACAANNQCIVGTTCCTSTDCTISGETCSGPGGTCACPVGQTGCAASGTCIPSANCCTNLDCKITGATCPTPGGTCACPAGFNSCIANNACIPSTECCTSADCKVTNETCSAPGGTCACASGNKVCTVSNSCIPTNTCCTSNDCLVTNQTCTGTGGNCVCPNSGSVCTIVSPPYNACIAKGQCCTNADCTGGGSCSGPGGSCNCPTGQTFCTANNLCIPSAECCTSADCKIATQTCSGPGGTCSCPVNQVVCGNLCIGNTTCCADVNCPPTSEVATTTCAGAPGGKCEILTCIPGSGWYDVDKSYANGCECQDDTVSKTCSSPTSLGSIGVGASAAKAGALPGVGEADFFIVTFPPAGRTDPSYHPKIVLTAAAGIVFDVTVDCALAVSCSDPASGAGLSSTWEEFGTGPNNPVVCTTGAGFCGGAALGSGGDGTLYIKVYRSSGTPTTCAEDQFTIAVSG